MQSQPDKSQFSALQQYCLQQLELDEHILEPILLKLSPSYLSSLQKGDNHSTPPKHPIKHSTIQPTESANSASVSRITPKKTTSKPRIPADVPDRFLNTDADSSTSTATQLAHKVIIDTEIHEPTAPQFGLWLVIDLVSIDKLKLGQRLIADLQLLLNIDAEHLHVVRAASLDNGFEKIANDPLLKKLFASGCSSVEINSQPTWSLVLAQSDVLADKFSSACCEFITHKNQPSAESSPSTNEDRSNELKQQLKHQLKQQRVFILPSLNRLLSDIEQKKYLIEEIMHLLKGQQSA